MTDRDLLEKAARAAGYDIRMWLESVSVTDNITVTGFIFKGNIWNPLENDADAFRLMADLNFKIYIQTDADKPYTIACDHGSGQYQAWASCEHGNDIYAATRRAIVLAAAKIGETNA